MSDRVKIIEDNLNVKLPQDYKNFINKIGIISDVRGEIYGYLENIDIEKIPCVIGATKLYKQNYLNLLPEDIIIAFDDFRNTPIVLNTKNEKIYVIEDERKKEEFSNFSEWFSIYNKTE
jgi:hypothetical protein